MPDLGTRGAQREEDELRFHSAVSRLKQAYIEASKYLGDSMPLASILANPKVVAIQSLSMYVCLYVCCHYT